MAPPVRKLPADYELAAGGHKGHKVTKHTIEKPFKQRPSRTPSVSSPNPRPNPIYDHGTLL